MKRILTGALAALLSFSALAATLNPISLLNPAGSTSGQAIVSTGATTAPAWTTITPAAIGGLKASNNLSDVASATAALTNLGGLSTTTAASTYLTQANATSTYLTQANATTTYGAKASPLSQFSATTSAQLAGVISDETGSGSVVFGTSPTITTPNILGVTNGTAAPAGNVGEPLSTTVPVGSAVPLSGGVPTNVGSLPLTAGDWDVWANMCTNPAGTTTQQTVGFSVSTTSATMNVSQEAAMPFSAAAGNSVCAQVPMAPLRVSTTTTVFMVAISNFSVSTNSAFGNLWARRRH